MDSRFKLLILQQNDTKKKKVYKLGFIIITNEGLTSAGIDKSSSFNMDYTTYLSSCPSLFYRRHLFRRCKKKIRSLNVTHHKIIEI